VKRISLVALAAAVLLANSATLAQEKTMTTSTGMELVWIPPGGVYDGEHSQRTCLGTSKGRLARTCQSGRR